MFLLVMNASTRCEFISERREKKRDYERMLMKVSASELNQGSNQSHSLKFVSSFYNVELVKTRMMQKSLELDLTQSQTSLDRERDPYRLLNGREKELLNRLEWLATNRTDVTETEK